MEIKKSGNGNGHNQQAAERTVSAGDDRLQLVSFRLSNEEFALNILNIQEIIRMQELTRVPNAAEFVEGVINLRGKVIPVIGLRRRLGLESKGHDRETRIVVVEVSGTVVGFVVDSVSEVLRIAPSTVEPPPRLVKVAREYISGVGKLDNRLLLLLDVNRVLNDTEQAACEHLSHE